MEPVLSFSSGRILEQRNRFERAAFASTIKRVFVLDVLECERCGSRMKILTTIRPMRQATAQLTFAKTSHASANTGVSSGPDTFPEALFGLVQQRFLDTLGLCFSRMRAHGGLQ